VLRLRGRGGEGESGAAEEDDGDGLSPAGVFIVAGATGAGGGRQGGGSERAEDGRGRMGKRGGKNKNWRDATARTRFAFCFLPSSLGSSPCG
jgi:hypothetical protein